MEIDFTREEHPADKEWVKEYDIKLVLDEEGRWNLKSTELEIIDAAIEFVKQTKLKAYKETFGWDVGEWAKRGIYA